MRVPASTRRRRTACSCDDAGVEAGVGRGRHAGQQRVQVRRAADPADLAEPGQLGRDGDRVGRLALAVEVDDDVEDRLVGRPVEVGGRARPRRRRRWRPWTAACRRAPTARRRCPAAGCARTRRAGRRGAATAAPPPGRTRRTPSPDAPARRARAHWSTGRVRQFRRAAPSASRAALWTALGTGWGPRGLSLWSAWGRSVDGAGRERRRVTACHLPTPVCTACGREKVGALAGRHVRRRARSRAARAPVRAPSQRRRRGAGRARPPLAA